MEMQEVEKSTAREDSRSILTQRASHREYDQDVSSGKVNDDNRQSQPRLTQYGEMEWSEQQDRTWIFGLGPTSRLTVDHGNQC